jgi:hypothetical protein
VLGELACIQLGDGAAAAATSSTDAPCPTRRGSGSLASRSTVLVGTLHLALPSRKRMSHLAHRRSGPGREERSAGGVRDQWDRITRRDAGPRWGHM